MKTTIALALLLSACGGRTGIDLETGEAPAAEPAAPIAPEAPSAPTATTQPTPATLPGPEDAAAPPAATSVAQPPADVAPDAAPAPSSTTGAIFCGAPVAQCPFGAHCTGWYVCTCDPLSCTGCCQDNVCHNGMGIDELPDGGADQACGAGGVACFECQAGTKCVNSACR